MCHRLPCYGDFNTYGCDPALTWVGAARKLSAGHCFADAVNWNVGLAYDGVHFPEEGHRAFAEGIRAALDGLLSKSHNGGTSL